MEIRILTANEIKTALPMPQAIEAMRVAFAQFSADLATVPLRGQIATEKGISLLMPAHLHQCNDLGVKIVSIYPNNPSAGLPVVSATVLVLDPDNGLPLALMDGNSLTAIRTGAGGGLAADLLAQKKAETLALFGAGVQARAQLEGVLAVRKITRVNLISRTLGAARKLADEIDAELGEILNGVKCGRQSNEEITFFKSVGIAVQDAVAASVALREAEKKGLGVSVKLS